MKRYMITTLIMITLLTSCDHGKKNTPDEQQFFVINYENALGNKKILNLTDIAASVRYIPLQTDSNCLIPGALSITSYYISYHMKLILFTFLITLCACKHTNDTDSLPIINFEKSIGSYSEIFLSSIAEKIEYIPLETGDSLRLLNEIREIEVSDDTIILHGYNYCKTFDRNGRFLFNIGRTGKGPGEYQYINEFSVNQNKHLIYITCNGKISVFTYKGVYIETIEIPFEEWSRSVYLNNNIFCHMVTVFKSDESIKLSFFNSNGKIIDSFINRQPFKRKSQGLIVALQPQLYHGCDYFIFKDGLNDTLYKINGDLQISPMYKIQYGKYKIPIDILKESTEIPFRDYIVIDDIIDSRDYLYFDFRFNKYYPFKYKDEKTLVGFGQRLTYNATQVAGMFNKKESLLTLLDGENGMGIRNDIDGGPSFWPKYIDLKNNEMYTWVDAYNFLGLDNNTEMNHIYADTTAHLKLINLIKGLDDSNNPIIIRVTTKMR